MMTRTKRSFDGFCDHDEDAKLHHDDNNDDDESRAIRHKRRRRQHRRSDSMQGLGNRLADLRTMIQKSTQLAHDLDADIRTLLVGPIPDVGKTGKDEGQLHHRDNDHPDKLLEQAGLIKESEADVVRRMKSVVMSQLVSRFGSPPAKTNSITKASSKSKEPSVAISISSRASDDDDDDNDSAAASVLMVDDFSKGGSLMRGGNDVHDKGGDNAHAAEYYDDDVNNGLGGSAVGLRRGLNSVAEWLGVRHRRRSRRDKQQTKKQQLAATDDHNNADETQLAAVIMDDQLQQQQQRNGMPNNNAMRQDTLSSSSFSFASSSLSSSSSESQMMMQQQHQMPSPWPSNVVPFEVDPGFSPAQRRNILSALAQYHERTCVRFRPREPGRDRDYVFVRRVAGDSEPCTSSLGYLGGIHTVTLNDKCVAQRGTILHELMHVLGFDHEQSRRDRDKYVHVNWDNITPGYERNFLQRQHMTDLNYDYGSIMHYPPHAFSDEPTVPTLVPKMDYPLRLIGQRLHLSSLDQSKINQIYRCDRHPIRPSSLYPTEELPSDSYMPVADKKFSHVLKNPDDYRYADACPRIRQMSLISRTRSCPSCTEKAANETSNNKNRFFSGNNAAS